MLFFRQRQPQKESRIGAGCHVEGHLQAEGSLQVDGAVRGPVTVSGDIEVSETGLIEGPEVRGQNIFVTGVVKANIYAEGQLTLGVTARVEGNIVAGAIDVDAGAYYTGHLTTYDSRTPFYNEADTDGAAISPLEQNSQQNSLPGASAQPTAIPSANPAEKVIPADEIAKVVIRQG